MSRMSDDEADRTERETDAATARAKAQNDKYDKEAKKRGREY